MSRTSQFLFVPTVDELDITGTPVSCLGSLHTIAVYVSNFVGKIHIEASIVVAPQGGDWFEIFEPFEYLQGETSVKGRTFSGNFLWLRARVERSYLSPPMSNAASAYGIVDKILLND